MEKDYYEEYKHQLIRKVVNKELDAFELIDLIIYILKNNKLKEDDLKWKI